MIARVLVCVLALSTVLEAGPRPVAILSIHQTRSLEPADVTVFVSIPPASENRGYWVIAECKTDGGLSTQSFRSLDGEASHGPFQPVTLRLSACEYAVGAVLIGEGGRVLARSELRTIRVQCRSACPSDREDAGDE